MRYAPPRLRLLFAPARAVTPLATRVAPSPHRTGRVSPSRGPATLPPRLRRASPGTVALSSVAARTDHDLGPAALTDQEPCHPDDRRTPPAGALRAIGAEAHSYTELRFAALQPGSTEVMLCGPHLVPGDGRLLRGGRGVDQPGNQSPAATRSGTGGTRSSFLTGLANQIHPTRTAEPDQPDSRNRAVTNRR